MNKLCNLLSDLSPNSPISVELFGTSYKSVYFAYQAWKNNPKNRLSSGKSAKILRLILVERFKQHPRLLLQLEREGGLAFLNQCKIITGIPDYDTMLKRAYLHVGVSDVRHI